MTFFYRFFYYVAKLVLWFWWDIKVVGKENIPEDGAAILVGNHQSNVDPVLIAIQTHREVHFLGKVELEKTKIGKWFFDHLHVIPVNRTSVSPATMKRSLQVLKSGELLGIFPEGTRVKDKANKPEVMSGYITFAIREKVPIIPVHIEGPGMGFRSKVYATIGQPIELIENYGKRVKGPELQKLADDVMDTIYAIELPYPDHKHEQKRIG